MKLGKAGLVVAVGMCVIMALLVVFGLELANTQAKSKNDVKVQMHDRALLASALIDSLFNTTLQQIPQYAQQYGGATVPDSKLDTAAAQQANTYLALLGPNGDILAHSSGFTQALANGISSSAAVKLVNSGHPYGLGNFSPYGKGGVIDFAVAFPTRFGTRVLVTGFGPSTLSTFLAGELKTIPGVKGEVNYLIDGNGAVLAATDPAVRLGQRATQPGVLLTLGRRSLESHATYFDSVLLTNSTWRLVLAAPNGPLFANVTGVHEFLPWILFAGFALVALFALILGWRVLRASEQIRHVNKELAAVNTELVEANSSLEQRAAELARSNEELDQFASIASHDLQEPLRKVRTFTEQLSVVDGEHLSEKGQDYLRRANGAAERMQNLIEDLLKFSRVSTQGRPFVPVDLDEVAHAVVSDLEAQITSTGAIVRIGQLPTIEADPLQMRQLLQNLVSNAIKFRRPDVVPEIDVQARVQGGAVQLTVRDNGIGFDPRYSMRIFRVFERLHGRSEYPGTGIGLALCRKIADRHHGTIVADSEPDVGSTFTVTLPISGFTTVNPTAGIEAHPMEAPVDA